MRAEHGFPPLPPSPTTTLPPPPPVTVDDCIGWGEETQVSDRNKMRHLMFDIFKQPLTHISSIPKGCVEWLLVMLEQVLDVSEAFDLEDLRFFLDHFPEIENGIIQIQCACPRAWPSITILLFTSIRLLLHCWKKRGKGGGADMSVMPTHLHFAVCIVRSDWRGNKNPTFTQSNHRYGNKEFNCTGCCHPRLMLASSVCRMLVIKTTELRNNRRWMKKNKRFFPSKVNSFGRLGV